MIIEIEKGVESGMAFIMTREHPVHPVLVQINNRLEFESSIRNNKFVTFKEAALIVDWNCSKGVFATDDLGWIENLTYNTDNIEWIMYY